jgi:hypothetical protein
MVERSFTERLGIPNSVACIVVIALSISPLAIAAGVPSAAADVGDRMDFMLPSATAGAVRITTGPDGNLWFTESPTLLITVN